MAFTVFTYDSDDQRGIHFGDEDEFWYEDGGILAVKSSLGVRYYSPNQWQEVHWRDHPIHKRPIVPSDGSRRSG
ncbi:hypothetical protein IU427_00870 [Nocardia beijingensis]|uniref:hypothetical protein n=1 Tax=Nocardia beijingensis TaxID=95162 RepID=UPI00189354C9|nr:hypothetical protein [Nocardia beijingensis]MBF6463730.1 hypothetical protein [Nocardia beijingensis]